MLPTRQNDPRQYIESCGAIDHVRGALVSRPRISPDAWTAVAIAGILAWGLMVYELAFA